MTRNTLITGGAIPVSLTLALTMSLALALEEPPAHAVEGAQELAGLWQARRDFTPEVRGDLRVSEEEGAWRAEIAGFSVAVETEGSDVRFQLPDSHGYFRGARVGKNIEGHWVQPRTQSNFAPYASPVRLVPTGSGRWRGKVRPLNDTLHFYLMLEPGEDGLLEGFIRNPEANIGRFYRIEKVARVGDGAGDGASDTNSYGVQLIDGRGQVRLEGTYHDDRGQLSLYFPFNGGSYDFVRVEDRRESPFYPRPRSDGPYRYRPPVDGEGWQAGSLEDAGLATGPIEEMIQMIIDTPMDSLESPYLHAFLVARHGRLVMEEYFHGFTRDTPHGTRSASKSVTTTLAGIAVHRGELSLDAPVYATMNGGPGRDTSDTGDPAAGSPGSPGSPGSDTGEPAGLDPRAERMTLRHLITMTSGLACDDWDQDSPGNEDTMQEQSEQPDWFQYTLDLPMINEPGEHAAYCSGGQNLTGALVARSTGEWLPDFFRKHLAGPLGMGLYHMNLTPTGEGYGGGGLLIKPRDFLKLGQLFLDGGSFQGKELLSEEWVREGTSAINQIRDEGYGYGWWVFSYPFEGREVEAFYAGGNGGQYVIVVPELDLNIVIFAGNYNQRVMHKSKYEYVRDYVLKAVAAGG